MRFLRCPYCAASRARSLLLVALLTALATALVLAQLGRATSSGATSPITVATGISNLNAAATVSGDNAASTRTLTGGVTGQRVCLRGIFIQATGANATFTLTISDGATVVVNLGTQALTAAAAPFILQGSPILCATGTNNLVINVGAGGAGAILTTTSVADRS